MQLRLIPIVIFALSSLLAVKALDILARGGISVDGTAPALAEDASKKQDFARAIAIARGGKEQKPEGKVLMRDGVFEQQPQTKDVTGSVAGAATDAQPAADKHATAGADVATADAPAKENAKPAKEAAPADHGAAADAGHGETKTDAAPVLPEKAPVATEAPLISLPSNSPSERALLERLQQRREQLDTQSRELDTRENLLRAAEKRIEERIAELKQMEAGVGAAQEKRDETEKTRLKGLVDMYASMKPKDAARIFDGLDTAILVDVATAMKPAVIGAIVANMSSEAATRLTIALANKSQAASDPGIAPGAPALELPKIEGTKPNG